MYLPKPVYNHLPHIWYGCAFATIFMGISGLLSSLMFICIFATVMTGRNNGHWAFLLSSFYAVFLLIVALSPRAGIW